jgi:ankyrin repeat protein/predicted DNA-binding WGR domain protein
MLNNHLDVTVFCLQKGVNFNRPVYDINFAAELCWRTNEDKLVQAKERMAGKGLVAIGLVQPGVIRESKVADYIRTRKEDEDLVRQMEGKYGDSPAGSPQGQSPRTRVQPTTFAKPQAASRYNKQLSGFQKNHPSKKLRSAADNNGSSNFTIDELKELLAKDFLNRKVSLFKLAIETNADAINYLLIDAGLSLGSAIMDTIDAGLFKYTVKLLSKRIDQNNPRFLDQFAYQNEKKENIAHAFGKNAATIDVATGEVILELFGTKKVPLNLPDERGISPLMYTAFHSKSLELINHMIARGADTRAKDKSGNWLVSCFLQNNPLLKKDREIEAVKAQNVPAKSRKRGKYQPINALQFMNPSTPVHQPIFSNFHGFGFTHSQSMSQPSFTATPQWSQSGGDFTQAKESQLFSNSFATPGAPIRRALTSGSFLQSGDPTFSINGDDTSPITSLSTQETEAIDWVVKQLLISQGHVNSRFERFQPDLQSSSYRARGLYTLLSFALKRLRNFPLARALLQHGADINAPDDRGHTVLTWAIKENQVEVFRFLMTFPDKIDFNYQDKDSKTYVHYIVSPLEFASYENVEFLQALGPKANLNKLDRTGRPPILYAAAQESHRMLQALRGLGAQPYHGPLTVKLFASQIVGEEFLENPFDFEDDHRKAIERAERMLKDTDREVVEQPRPSHLIVGKTTMCADENGRPYEIKLIKVEIKYGHYSENVFYVMQIVKDEVRRIYVLFTNWGRVGTEGQHQQTPFFTLEEAIKEFRKIYKEKTGNEYGNPANFVKKPSKYRQIFVAPRTKHQHFVALFDPMTAMTVPARIQPDLMDLVAHITDKKLLQVVYNQFNLDPEVMPFGNLTQEVIQEAKHALSEIAALARNLSANAKQLTSREMFEIGMEISEKTSRYLELIPTVGSRVEQIPPFNLNRVNQEIIRLNDLENLEIVSRILGAATYRLKEMHPYEYTLRSLGIKIVRLPEENEEHALVQRYVKATRESTQFVISNVYAVERRGEADAFAHGTVQGNVRLLWHGTRTENVIGILNQGLRITPSEAQKTGARLGAGLYFSDTFERAISFSSDFSNWDQTQKVYALLCEVALGKMQKVYEEKDYKPPGTEFNSTKGQGRQTPDKEQRIYLSNGTMIPIGKPVAKREQPPVEDRRWNFEESEYVVYSKTQAKIKYLVELSYVKNGEEESNSSVWD